MKDRDFLRRLLLGTMPVPMVTGIRMELEIETTEEVQNGVWQPTQRDVIHVRRLIPPLRQTDLPLAPLRDEEDGSAPDDDGSGH